jgi:hypothetical protein
LFEPNFGQEQQKEKSEESDQNPAFAFKVFLMNSPIFFVAQAND